VTATRALCNATLPYVLAIADEGLEGALEARPELGGGLTVRDGAIVNPAVAGALAAG
jgi:alanine dehydrogenase